MVDEGNAETHIWSISVLIFLESGTGKAFLDISCQSMAMLLHKSLGVTVNDGRLLLLGSHWISSNLSEVFTGVSDMNRISGSSSWAWVATSGSCRGVP